MPVDRRQFLTRATLAAAGARFAPEAWTLASQNSSSTAGASKQKAYGSGYFGEWIEDEFGLPGFHYTCDQIHDPKAVTQVNPGILSSTEHIHQVGNDRLVAIVSNYGHVRVRQDEGAPKFLADYVPVRGWFAGAIAHLPHPHAILSTFYPAHPKHFDLT